MKESDYGNRFWNIITHEAARDATLRNAIRWMVWQSDALVDPSNADEPDYAEVMARIADRYGLAPEGVNEAFTICEDAIVDELKLQKPERNQ